MSNPTRGTPAPPTATKFEKGRYQKMEMIIGAVILLLIGGGIALMAGGNIGGGGRETDIDDCIRTADAARPVLRASWRDARGNRGSYERERERPTAAAPAAIAIAGGGAAPAAAGAGWWPWPVNPTPPADHTPPAAGGRLTLEVDEVAPAPAGGGPAAYAVRVSGGTGTVAWGITGLPATWPWTVAPAPFIAPRGGALGITVPPPGAGVPARPLTVTLVATVGGAAATARVVIN